MVVLQICMSFGKDSVSEASTVDYFSQGSLHQSRSSFLSLKAGEVEVIFAIPFDSESQHVELESELGQR